MSEIIRVGMADLKIAKRPDYVNNSWTWFMCWHCVI